MQKLRNCETAKLWNSTTQSEIHNKKYFWAEQGRMPTYFNRTRPSRVSDVTWCVCFALSLGIPGKVPMRGGNACLCLVGLRAGSMRVYKEKS